MKGFISLEILTGYVLVLIIYLVGFYPIIRDTIAQVTGVDELTSFALGLVPVAFLIAIMVGIISYGVGKRPEGVWGGE